jgi:hypothetical protein
MKPCLPLVFTPRMKPCPPSRGADNGETILGGGLLRGLTFSMVHARSPFDSFALLSRSGQALCPLEKTRAFGMTQGRGGASLSRSDFAGRSVRATQTVLDKNLRPTHSMADSRWECPTHAGEGAHSTPSGRSGQAPRHTRPTHTHLW